MTDALTKQSLSVVEQTRLVALEGVIEAGLATFAQVGGALLEVRDGRLYRDSYGTFEDYCRERWNLKRQRAYELMEAGAVVSEISDTPPSRESHAAALAPLLDEPETLRETWAEVRELHPEPTAANVREAVARHRPTLTVPISDELLERQQRQTLIDDLDAAVRALEFSATHARAEAKRLLALGDAGPFTPERFDRVAEYAIAFAHALREGGDHG